MTIPKFQETILNWYWQNKRNLPWRNTRDPYKILVSEIMLQQTQIPRVLPKYKEFLKAFPTIEALAKAPDTKLLKVWQGLGYWRRAKYLKETAKIIVNEYNGKFPEDPKELEKLPGIGHYTARALACFSAQGEPASGGAPCEAFLDTNIRRVYLHFFFPNKENISDKEILKIARKATQHLDQRQIITPKEWHYALFDYGAIVLKDKSINKRSKHYTKQSKFEGSFRSFRTKVVRFLLARPQNKATYEDLEQFLRQALKKNNSQYTTEEILQSLLQDNLIKKTIKYYTI